MKRSLVFLVSFLIFSTFLFCYELTLVSKMESIYLAQNWITFINKIPLEGKLGEYQIKFIEQVNHKGFPLCEIYHLYPKGHILVPSYKEFPPVKSFSLISDFNSKSMGYEFSILEELKAAFEFLQSYSLGESKELEMSLRQNSIQWNKFVGIDLQGARLKEPEFKPRKSKADKKTFILKDIFGVKLETTTASPLLKTKWGQGEPYWNGCPTLGGYRCVVGCVATAMAQIMRYYKWPNNGEGSHSYYWSDGGEWLNADFSDSYDWDYMPNEKGDYDTARESEAVAELCYEAGVSVNMSYGTEGSSAYVSRVDDALKVYFNYSNAVRVVYRYYYSNVDEWFDVLKNQRDLSRPLEFAMYSPDDSGHAVVIDGYLVSDGLKQVHINMGWNGWYDAYYTLDNILEEGIFDFTDTFWQHAVIDIIPLSATQYTLTLTSSGGGTTDPTPGSYTYDEGTQVAISAIPDNGYEFSGWSGDASGTDNPLTIAMDSNKSIKANFVQQTAQYTLTITAVAGGTTNPAPGSYTYVEGTQVAITAIADGGYRFTGWSGDASGLTNPITVTMNSNKSVKANFIRQYTLTLISGNGGTTEPTPGEHVYDEGTEVTITAIAETNYRFGEWSGDASGTSNPITVTMNSDKSITASFIRLYKLYLASEEHGSTDPAPGEHIYDEGTEVSVTALPDTHYRFNGWSGDVSSEKKNDNPLTITMNSDKSLIASFQRIIYPPLNFTGEKVLNYSLSQDEYIDVLTWEANPDNENIEKYRIYLIEGESRSLLIELDVNTFKYWHRNVEKDTQYAYALIAVNNENREGDPAYISVK